jgi:hypothetical protein
MPLSAYIHRQEVSQGLPRAVGEFLRFFWVHRKGSSSFSGSFYFFSLVAKAVDIAVGDACLIIRKAIEPLGCFFGQLAAGQISILISCKPILVLIAGEC